MTMRRLLPLTALLAAVALVGCGSSSDQPSASDAQSDYASVRTQIVGLGSSIGTAITSASRETDAQLASAFSALAVRGRAAVARLDAIDVPDSLTAKRDALRDAVERGVGDLRDIATAARDSDAAAARAAAAQLIADSQQIGTARASFERALDSAANSN
jgi:ABC-type enterochelin transport system substrate-binding protein